MLLHQADRLLVELRAMLDRGGTGAHRVQGTGQAVRVRHHLQVAPRRFLHHRFHLFVGELQDVQGPIDVADPARHHHLDHLRTVLDLVPHRAQQLLGAVRDPLPGARLEDAGRPPGVVAMSPRHTDLVPGRNDARPHRDPLLDRLLERHVDEIVVARRTNGGEPREQSQTRIVGGLEGAVHRSIEEIVGETVVA